MDAPPQREDCRPFVRIAALMRAAGLNTPEVLAQDLERGFLLLTDLGTTTYLSALNDANADDLFRDAVDALLKLQLASRAGVLPFWAASRARMLSAITGMSSLQSRNGGILSSITFRR